MSIAIENKLEAVVTDLKWIRDTESVSFGVFKAIETAELILSSLRFGRTKLPDVPENPTTTALEVSDLKALLVKCARVEDDNGNLVCAERIRGAIRLLL